MSRPTRDGGRAYPPSRRVRAGWATAVVAAVVSASACGGEDDGGFGASGGSAGADALSSGGAPGATGGFGPGASGGAGGSAPTSGGSGPSTGGGGEPPPPVLSVVDDFEDGDASILPVDGRSGEWTTFGDGTGTATIDVVPDPTGRSQNAAQVAVTGFTEWGGGVVAELLAGETANAPYDASAHDGIVFWARSDGGSATLQVMLPDRNTDQAGGVCTSCWDHFSATVDLGAEWQRYELRWSDFAQGGWGDEQPAVDTSAIYVIQFQVAGGQDATFWLDDVAFAAGLAAPPDPGTGGAGTGGAGTGGAGTGGAGTGGHSVGSGGGPVVDPNPPVIVGGPWTTTEQYETFELTVDGVGYNVKTNAWGGYDGSQELTVGGDLIFRINRQDASSSNMVRTFPAVYRGIDQDGSETANSHLPIEVADIASAQTGFHTNSLGQSGVFNSAYDIYFDNDPNVDGGEPDIFLMVWLDVRDGINPTVNGGRGYSCGGEVPYLDSCPEPETLVLPGVGEFYVYVGKQHSGKLVISYVKYPFVNGLDFDIRALIDDALDKQYSVDGLSPLNDGMVLYGIQAGFEILSGGAGLEVSDFYALINGQ